jgi:hypothetical protein
MGKDSSDLIGSQTFFVHTFFGLTFDTVVSPNVVVKWFNTPASYSGGPAFKSRPQIGYSDWRFSWFSLVPPQEYQKIRPRPLPSKSFPIHHSLVLSIRRCIVWVTGKVSLDKLQNKIRHCRSQLTTSLDIEGFAKLYDTEYLILKLRPRQGLASEWRANRTERLTGSRSAHHI